MKIAIVNTLPIPSGEASVNRILSYSKGLVRNNNEVCILSSGKPINDKVGSIDGVNYVSFGSRSKLRALYDILTYIVNNEIEIVILVSNSLLLIYPLAFVCKRNKIKFIQEKSEFPFVLMKKGIFNKLYAKFYVNTTYKLFDGMIVMTKPLMEYFIKKVSTKCILFEMPMTVDVERFNIPKTDSELGDYIAYCGNMSGNKDGVINLIDAFNMASNIVGNIKLVLIGACDSEKEYNKIKSYARMLNDNIVLLGKIDREEIPKLLVNAKALALARPSSLQSTGGFPTKLGEYLSTGNPVIVTKVGDIPLYLNDSNSYLVNPNDNNAFSDAIIAVFKDYETAIKKGINGRKLAYSIFNSKYQADRLNKYLYSVK